MSDPIPGTQTTSVQLNELLRLVDANHIYLVHTARFVGSYLHPTILMEHSRTSIDIKMSDHFAQAPIPVLGEILRIQIDRSRGKREFKYGPLATIYVQSDQFITRARELLRRRCYEFNVTHVHKYKGVTLDARYIVGQYLSRFPRPVRTWVMDSIYINWRKDSIDATIAPLISVDVHSRMVLLDPLLGSVAMTPAIAEYAILHAVSKILAWDVSKDILDKTKMNEYMASFLKEYPNLPNVIKAIKWKIG